MSTPFEFRIPTPCHEDWNQMTPEAQGRFCAACKKCVFDLTEKQPAEIADLYAAHGGDLCGRIRVGQLQAAPRPQRLSVRRLLAQVQPTGWNAVRRFAFALFLAFGLFQVGAAQTLHPDPMEVIAGGLRATHPIENPPVAIVTHHIEGHVSNADGSAANRVDVVVEASDGKTFHGRTDAEGRFDFEVKTSAAPTAIYAQRGKEKSARLLMPTGAYYDECSSLRGYLLRFPHTKSNKPLADKPEEHAVLESDDTPAEDASATPEQLDRRTPVLSDLFETAPALQVDGPESIRLEAFQFRTFPNPASGIVWLIAEQPMSEILQIRLFDLYAAVLYDQPWRPTDGAAFQIPTDQLAAGPYLLQVTSPSGQTVMRRFIVQ